jgi:integrase
MQKTGYRPSTVKTCIRSLKAVARRANLLDPESVKGYLATASVSVNRKQTVTEHLARFYKWKRIPFQAPRYKRIENMPFIPSEIEVDQLIAGTNSKVAAFLQVIKETAARPGEAWSLRWIDLDSTRHCIRITPEKGSRPRERKVSRLVHMPTRHRGEDCDGCGDSEQN